MIELNGFLIKAISESFTQEHLAGQLKGLVAEIVEEDRAVVYEIERQKDKTMANALFFWENGKLSDCVPETIAVEDMLEEKTCCFRHENRIFHQLRV